MSDGAAVTAAVIGLGDISVTHLDAIASNPRIRLAGVCDVDGDRAAQAANDLGVPGFTDHRTLFETVHPQVVHVTTPHHQHVPVALDAIDAGIHVLTEKPVAHTIAEGRRLVEGTAAGSVKVGVVLQNRYNPTSVAIRDVLRAGTLGPIEGGRAAVWWSRPAAYYAASPWRARWSESGGGVLINQALHTLDLMLWFLGDPVRMQGTAATLALADAIEVEDTATLVMDHDDGARSVVFATNAHHTNASIELQITGRDGTVALQGGEAVLTDGAGTKLLAADTRPSGERSYWGVSHSLLIDDFYATLAEPAPFWLSPAVGMKALTVLRTAYARAGLLPEGMPL